MMMMSADGPGAVSPIDFSERRRPTPKWLWGGIAISAALHVAGGAWLYYQRVETPPMAPPVDGPVTIVDLFRPKPVVTPQPTTETPAPNAPVHETPLPTQPTDTIVATPSDAEQPAGPITISQPVPDTTSTTVVADPPRPPADPVIRNPQWISRPSAAELMRAYPDRALERGVSGSATLSCGVRADGAMTGCTIASETPSGQGFGRAAMSLSRDFRISPRTVDGTAIEGARVSIPIRFDAPAD